MRYGIAFCVGCLVFFATSITARAEVVLQPPGLQPGDLYRLVFVTSGARDATSSDIADYNAFVQAAADLSSLAALGKNWKAIASTATVSARDNTGTSQAGVNDYPIYSVDGTLVAVSNTDLWDGSIANPISFDEWGTTRDVLVWTGSTFGGASEITYHLGVAEPNGGQSTVTGPNWIAAFSWTAENPLPFYAISAPITAVPEPASYILAIIGVASLALFGVRRLRSLRVSV